MKKILIITFVLLLSKTTFARFDFGYMMRFASFTYTPRGTGQGVDGNVYNINGTTGSDMYVSVSGYLGNWNIQLFSNMRSTTFKIPANIPVPPTPNDPQTVTTTMTGLKFGFGKANIMPFFGFVTDQIIFVPQQTSSTVSFLLKTENVTYATVGGTIFGLGNKPTLEAKGSLEIMFPISAPTINSQDFSSSYITQINIEINFGKNKNFGLMGSVGFQDYKDINEYHNNFFSGGLKVGF